MQKVEFPAADFYDLDVCAERLQHKTPESALMGWLDGRLDFNQEVKRQLVAMRVTVFCYKRSSGPTARALERLVFQLDDQVHLWWQENGWGDPEDSVKSPDGFQNALQTALGMFVVNSPVWSCEVFDHMDLSGEQLLEFVSLHSPQWLEVKEPKRSAANWMAADRVDREAGRMHPLYLEALKSQASR